MVLCPPPSSLLQISHSGSGASVSHLWWKPSKRIQRQLLDTCYVLFLEVSRYFSLNWFVFCPCLGKLSFPGILCFFGPNKDWCFSDIHGGWCWRKMLHKIQRKKYKGNSKWAWTQMIRRGFKLLYTVVPNKSFRWEIEVWKPLKMYKVRGIWFC